MHRYGTIIKSSAISVYQRRTQLGNDFFFIIWSFVEPDTILSVGWSLCKRSVVECRKLKETEMKVVYSK